MEHRYYVLNGDKLKLIYDNTERLLNLIMTLKISHRSDL